MRTIKIVQLSINNIRDWTTSTNKCIFLSHVNGTLCIQMNIELSIARIYLCSNLKNPVRDTTVLESWTGA